MRSLLFLLPKCANWKLRYNKKLREAIEYFYKLHFNNNKEVRNCELIANKRLQA